MKIIGANTVRTVGALLTRTALAGLLAGAAIMASSQRANAQVAFDVRLGHAGYVERVPVYGPPAYGPVGERPFLPYGRFYGPVPERYGWGHREFEERRDREFRERAFRDERHFDRR